MESKDFDILASLVTNYDPRLLVLEIGRAMIEKGEELVKQSDNDASTQKARALITSGQNIRNLSAGVR
jgi:hypothetical protein